MTKPFPSFDETRALAIRFRQLNGDFPPRWRMAAQIAYSGKVNTVNPVDNSDWFRDSWDGSSPMKALKQEVAKRGACICNIGVYNTERSGITCAVIPAFSTSSWDFNFRCRMHDDICVGKVERVTRKLLFFSLEIECDGHTYSTKVAPDGRLMLERFECESRISPTALLTSDVQQLKQCFQDAGETLIRTQRLQADISILLQESEASFSLYNSISMMGEQCSLWEQQLRGVNEYKLFRVRLANFVSRTTSILDNVGYRRQGIETRTLAATALERFKEKTVKPLVIEFDSIQIQAKEIHNLRRK